MTEFEYKNADRRISETLKAFGLSDKQIADLTTACYKLATTTLYQNSDLTIHLLHQCVDLISGKKETSDEILERLTKEYSATVSEIPGKTLPGEQENPNNILGIIAGNGLANPPFETR